MQFLAAGMLALVGPRSGWCRCEKIRTKSDDPRD